jgi:hypothetical protein
MAQSIGRYVLSAGGRYASNASGILVSNVGEGTINTFPSATNYLTEGFVQPFYLIAVSVPDALNAATTVIYPNPASERVFISTGHRVNSFIVEIYDVQGRKLIRDNTLSQVADSIFILDIASIAKGVYFLRLIDTSDRLTFENIKLLKE